MLAGLEKLLRHVSGGSAPDHIIHCTGCHGGLSGPVTHRPLPAKFRAKQELAHKSDGAWLPPSAHIGSASACVLATLHKRRGHWEVNANGQPSPQLLITALSPRASQKENPPPGPGLNCLKSSYVVLSKGTGEPATRRLQPPAPSWVLRQAPSPRPSVPS